MRIEVICGTGTGETTLSAFDAALKNSGIHNFNLIVLSSVIPPHSEVVRVDRRILKNDEWGNRLYVVKADVRSEIVGDYIAAGLGWYQLEDGRGMFVEHSGTSDSEEEVETKVKNRIRKSLLDLCINRSIHFNEFGVNMALSSILVKNKPTCALSVAVYQSEGWK